MTLSTRDAPAGPIAPAREHRLGTAQGTALFVGAVLGPGVLALPHLAAAAAGPASILAWAALLALSAPVALTFAALGARYPDGGGVATFAGRAFGPRAAAIVGWWFYGIVPVGTLAGALIGGDYVTSAVGLDHAWAVVVAVGLLAAAFATNHGGLRMSGRVQLVLVCGLAVLLATAIVTAGPRVSSANFTPFAPHGALGVVHAAGVLFFAFAGWEAASHLSGEFADPRRSMLRATTLTLLIVGVLYLGLVVTVLGVLGGRAATSPVPLALLLQEGIGSGARAATGVAAVILSFIAVNTYIAGGARLGAALARDGALPAALAKGEGPGRVPHRSLGLLAVLTGLVTAVAVPYGLGLDTLMRATSACLAAVTVVGMAAAFRLLPRADRRGRTLAAVATAFTGLVLLSCGAYLLLPVVLAAGALAARRR
ncbi:amino acid permease [Actinoallomurus spadix]|uniref:Amino acid permease n=1 Tax=Actinoallomurus spadix TaxID=79912 RepID=A0ABN0X4R1_9ACTN|nr:amino acid permease [Actinoallomurus spadix]MCO5986799.1 amino acid permease [Actinoallomurus spadix]